VCVRYILQFFYLINTRIIARKFVIKTVSDQTCKVIIPEIEIYDETSVIINFKFSDKVCEIYCIQSSLRIKRSKSFCYSGSNPCYDNYVLINFIIITLYKQHSLVIISLYSFVTRIKFLELPYLYINKYNKL